MSSIVIDASIAIAVVRGEPEGAAAATLIRHARDEVAAVVPSHFWLEVTNSLSRRHGWTGAEVLAAIHRLDDLQLETIEVDRALLVSAIDIAERHRLTSYDAMYLALANAVDASLMSLDGALLEAAGARAIGFDGHRLSKAPAPYEHHVTWPNYKGASAFLARLRAETRDVASS